MSDTEAVEEVPIEDELGDIFDKANAEEAVEEVVDSGRDEKGRFKAKETSDTEETVEAVEIEGAVEETSDEAEALEAPALWSDAEKANWSNLTRELQEAVLQREGDWQKADSERQERLKGYEPIEAALQSVSQRLQLNGVEPGQYVAQLVAADEFLRNNPQDALRWIAQQYNIDLAQPPAEDIDPTLAPIVNELNTLKTQLSQNVAQQQQAEAQRVNAEIEAFAKDKPHFEEVRSHMGALMQAGQATDMDAAYDQAVWANPSTRAKMQAEASKQVALKAKEDTEAKAKKAKRIADTNLSTTGAAAGTTPPQFDTREDELSALYDNIQGA